MVARLFAIIRKEFIHIVRDPRTLAVIFVMPLMQLILLGYAATTDVRNIAVAVLDQDHSAQSRQLLDAYAASGEFSLNHIAASEQELTRLIDSGTVSAGMIIPPGYGSDVKSGRQGQIAFFIDGSDPSVAGTALSAATLIGQSESTAVQVASLERSGVGMAMTTRPIEVRTRVWYNPDMVSAYFMIPALIGQILQMQATLLTSGAIVREREKGTIEQLIVTPIKPFELMVGKTLPYMLVAFLLIVEVLVAGTFWFSVPIRGSIVLLLAISTLFLLTTLGLGLLISTVASTQQEAMLLTMATMLPSIFLSGFIYPIAAMPWVLQVISRVIPLTYFLQVVRAVIVKGVGIDVLVPQTVALAIFATVLLILASLRFKKRLE